MNDEKERIRPIAGHLMSYCQSHLGFKDPPELFFADDEENASKDLGKTAFYDPTNKSVTVFVTGRHTKDVLRSIAHELVHHMQNLRGDFKDVVDTSPGYAQKDSNLREKEAEAYLLGNLLFRDWEDGIKTKKLKTNIVIKEEKNKMNKDLIKQLIKKRLLEMLQNEEEVNEKEVSEGCPPEEAPVNDISGLAAQAMAAIQELASAAGADMHADVGPEGMPPPVPMQENEEELEERTQNPYEDKEGYQSPEEQHPPAKADPKKEQKELEEADKVEEGEEELEEAGMPYNRDDEIEEGEDLRVPENENTLNESRFGDRRNNIYHRLMKEWIKK